MGGWSRLSAKVGMGGIAWQILCPLVALIIVSNILVISIVMRQLDAQLLTVGQNKLDQISELQAVKFTSNIEELVNDVRIVSRTAPVQAIINASIYSDGEIQDGLSVKAWRAQLAKIFFEILNFKSRYDQIRLVLADGSEWLRVDRYGRDNTIRIVPADELQNKGSTSYFQAAIKTKAGSVALSNIELNREFGDIALPLNPMIRASMPLYADGGQLFGVLIFNQSFLEGFAELRDLAGEDTNVLLGNSAGEYILHNDANKTFQFEYGRSANIVDDFPVANAILSEKADSYRAGISGVGAEEKIYSIRAINYGPDLEKDRLIIATTHHLSDVLQVRESLLKKIYLLVFLIVVIAIALAIVISRRIAKPIKRMRDVLKDKGLNTDSNALPLSARGEVGDLARVFDKFISELSHRQNILREEVHERKGAQAALEDNNDKLIALNQEMEQFAYIVSHDLQEPLRTVASFVDLLVQHNIEQQDEQVKVFHGFIDDAIRRMRELVTGLLDFSRLGAESQSEKVDCQALVEAVCSDLRTQIEGVQAEIHYVDLPCLTGRRTELRVLFQNLISNGIKFSRKDVSPVVHISAVRQGCEWVFCVRDNGIGISDAHFDKVFSIFQRLNNRDDYEGTGIGLAHCKKIVQMHRGRIWLESCLGEGSAFYFSLRDSENE